MTFWLMTENVLLNGAHITHTQLRQTDLMNLKARQHVDCTVNSFHNPGNSQGSLKVLAQQTINSLYIQHSANTQRTQPRRVICSWKLASTLNADQAENQQ